MSASSPALAAYLTASRLAGLVAPLILKRRLARGKEHPERLGERLGRAGMARPEGRLIWLHGASVGEAVSMLPLITALRAQAAAEILVTSGTVTSAERLGPLLPEGARHQFVPVDTAGAVSGFLDHWRPDLAIWVESELWPRLVSETARRGIPMALVNARLSAKSARRWRRAPAMFQSLLGCFALIMTQDRETEARLRDFGATARFAGNLKALVAPPDDHAPNLSGLGHRIAGRPVWLAASTHPGEEVLVAQAHGELRRHVPDALLILAPRHPARGAEVGRILADTGLSTAQRSHGENPGPETAVWLADTLGEMDLWYQLARVGFIGGSLVEMGGHTPFEPISHGVAILHGPHTANFAPAYRALAAAEGAIEVRTPAELAKAVGVLLADPDRRATLIEAAHATHAGLKPDVGAMARELLALMERRS